MGSAFQALPPPGPPPPGVVYPTTVTNQPSSHSNGSFGMVFAVLAIIFVVSALACVIGRICNKRSQRASNQQRNSNKYRDHGPPPSHDHRDFGREDHGNNFPMNGRAKERDVEFGFGPKEGDRNGEFGFDKKIPKIKIVPHEGRGQRMPPQNGEFGGPSMVNQMRMMESPRNLR